MIDSIMSAIEQGLQWIVTHLDEPLWNIAILMLLGVGTFFTLSTGFVQIRFFPHSLKEMWAGREMEGNSLTPFQAFATGLASRVGVGNISGVATAIAIGGPGAIFWMWATALLGMSSAFAESTLAQLFKVKNSDGTFRGGPAYYITKGLRKPWLAAIFAIALCFSFGFAFEAVQANSIVEATKNAWGWNEKYVGIALVILSGAIIFGGVKRIGVFAARIVPMMAFFYLIMAFIILGMHYDQIPSIIALIWNSAFDFSAMAGGFFGAVLSRAMLHGIKRGLFSNEAGMGSAPNAAATADVKHPASQGLIQMLGVFVDTMIVCTCTAIIILLSDNYGGEHLKSISLTQTALQYHVGEFGLHFLAFMLLLFAFSSIIGNYAYAENNIRYLKNHPTVIIIFRFLVLFFVYFGSVNSGNIVWAFADTVMAIMALINLSSIIFLAPIVWELMKDYQRQFKENKVPVFNLNNHPKLAKLDLDPEVWKK